MEDTHILPNFESEIHKILSNCPNKQSDSDARLAPYTVRIYHQHCELVAHFWLVPPHSQRICYFFTPQEIHLRQRSAL